MNAIKKITVLFLFLFPVVLFAVSKDYPIKQEEYDGKDEKNLRNFIDVEMKISEEKTLYFTVSLPKEIPKEGLPIVICVAGRQTGRKSLSYIPNHDQFAIIAYEYPLPVKNVKEEMKLSELFALRKSVLEIPYDLLWVAEWAKKQKWSGKFDPSIWGFSFGALFVPPTYHYAAQKNFSLGPGVIAYWGAGLFCILKHNLPFAFPLRWSYAALISLLFQPLEPRLHFPYIHNIPFLVINGIYDQFIPWKCALRLQKMVPEPKTIIDLPTKHIEMGNLALLKEIQEICRDWILKQLFPTKEKSLSLPKVAE